MSPGAVRCRYAGGSGTERPIRDGPFRGSIDSEATHEPVTTPQEPPCSGIEKVLLPELILLLLKRFQVALHAIEPVHTRLELFGQAAKERGHTAVFELIECGDNAVGFFACFLVVDQTIETQRMAR